MGGCAEAGLAGAAPADGPSRDRRRVEAVDVGPVGWLVLVSPRAGRGGASRRSCGLVSPQPLNVGQHERPTLAGRLDGARGSRLTSMTSTTTSHNAPGDRFKRRWLTSLTHQRRPHIRRRRTRQPCRRRAIALPRLRSRARRRSRRCSWCKAAAFGDLPSVREIAGMGTGWRHSRHLVIALLFPGVPARHAQATAVPFAVALARTSNTGGRPAGNVSPDSGVDDILRTEHEITCRRPGRA